MWFKPSVGTSKLRHNSSYEDNLSRYGWNRHDGRSYGVQEIVDPENQVQLTATWVKPELETDPDHWILRVEGEQLSQDALSEDGDEDLSLVWYISTPDESPASFDTDHIFGTHSSRGDYQFAFIDETERHTESDSDS